VRPVALSGRSPLCVVSLVDQDLTTGVLAPDLSATSILVLTDVDRVYLSFGRTELALEAVGARAGTWLHA